MKASYKKRWLVALRSGEFKQGQGALRKEYRGNYAYCCLGVLCTLTKGKWNGDFRPAGKDRNGQRHKADPAYLPLRTRQLTDVSLERCQELASFNDKGDSFKQIADWIEKHL